MSEQIVDLQNEFDRAELAGDREVIQRLIAEDFVPIGPKGFTLSNHNQATCRDESVSVTVRVSQV